MMPKFPPNPPPDQKIRSLLTQMLIQKLSLLFFLLKKRKRKKKLIVENPLLLPLRMGGFDSWGIKYKGVGTETILPPLTLPSHVVWKGREYVKCPISMTTSCLPPTLVGRRGKAPMSPWRLSPSKTSSSG